MTDPDIKKIFASNRVDVPDDGFSARVTGQLPERTSLLPQIVMALFIMTGLALTVVVQGVTPFLHQLDSLITSISYMQIPSPGSIIAYVGALALLGIIGYSVSQAGSR